MLKVWLLIATIIGISTTTETGRLQENVPNEHESLEQLHRMYAKLLKRLEDDEILLHQVMNDNEKLHDENNALKQENNDIRETVENLQRNLPGTFLLCKRLDYLFNFASEIQDASKIRHQKVSLTVCKRSDFLLQIMEMPYSTFICPMVTKQQKGLLYNTM